VKFDARWIRRLMDTGPGRALLAVMVSDFHEQGILSIFEGIEEDWQLDVADNVDADMVQGFLLARPELVPGDFGWAAGDGLAHGKGSLPPAATRRHQAPRRSFGRR
jgi:EAL domain-containing protein (putative c-di-GMP-specific phosphodiesterase class I)